jgi:hypothetical protein
MDKFDIPIALIIFKRVDKPLMILERIAQVKPQKIYLLADGGRNAKEHEQALECRRQIESMINWECEVIKRYSPTNIGVYENIAGGAKWLFQQEEFAIFLEDDTLPEITFFHYCKDLLEKYKDNEKVLWICGTNYLQKYKPKDKSSYVFTKCMLPCGWASWSEKFLTFYDSDITNMSNPSNRSEILSSYIDNALYQQDMINVDYEINYFKKYGRFYSWDYQMAYSIRLNKLLGIAPTCNLITNIGVDNDSVHGGNNLNDPMTNRFCNVDSFPISFPLNHPNEVCVDLDFEKEIEQIIIDQRLFSLRARASRYVRKLLNIDADVALLSYLKNLLPSFTRP